jgi:spore coat polysaccharide biosynthesis predicted glycosyltransferase SpsG
VRLVVGPWGRGANDRRVVEVRAPEGLVDELAAADLVVTAGGVTLLESLALGRPTVAMALADNQRRAVMGAGVAGAAYVADADSAARVAAALAADHRARTGLFHEGRRTIDGLGSARVADEVARQMSLAV